MKAYLGAIVLTALTLHPLQCEARALTPAERAAVEKAIKDQLIDPDSARFKHPDVPFAPGLVSGLYCGYVNSKNRSGGYNGDVQFMAAFTRVTIKPVQYRGDVIGIADIDPNSAESQSISEICAEKAPRALTNSVVK